MEYEKRRESVEQLLNQAILLAAIQDTEMIGLINQNSQCHLTREGDDAITHCLKGMRELLFGVDGPFCEKP